MKLASLKLFVLLPVLALAFTTQAEPLAVPPKVDPELIKDVGNKAIAGLLQEMCKAPRLAATNAPREFAVLPLESDLDQGYFTSQLRNQYTSICGVAGFRLYAPRETAEWDSLLKEIEWGDQKKDFMDPATVQKFGKIHGIAGLIRGRVVSVSVSEEGVLKVRVNIQAFTVETGEQIWGGDRAEEAQLKTRVTAMDIKPYLLPGLGVLIVLGVLWKVKSAMAAARRPR